MRHTGDLIMKRMLSALLILALLFTLCACGGNSANTTDDSTQQTDSTPLDDNPKSPVFAYIEDTIKATLKNPNSLIINSISEKVDPITDDEYSYYIVDVDYSAQNGFGGYNREQKVYYAKCSNDGKAVSIISDVEYYNATDECLYKDSLSKLESADKIPFALICTAATYNDVTAFLGNANIEYTIYNNPDNTPKEIQYLCDVFGLTGVVQITFNENKTISTITYGKYNGQIFYDANANKTITFEDDTTVVTQTNISKLKDNITNILGVNGTEKDEDSLSYYTSRSCKWVLSNSLSVNMKWDTITEDSSICYLSVTFENSINKEK